MKLNLVVTTILIALLIGACGASPTQAPEPTPDVAAVRTSAASTVVSQFTLTAAAFSPVPPPPPTQTNTPEPTATSTEPPVAQVTNAQGTTIALCDKYAWDVSTVDVNIPDNTVMSPGQEFVKTWKVKNTGACTWGEGYKLIYSYGDKMDGVAQALTAAIAPGQEVDVSVTFKAPALAGSYQSFWTLQNPKGIAFQGNEGKVLYVLINVQ